LFRIRNLKKVLRERRLKGLNQIRRVMDEYLEKSKENERR